MKGATKMGRFSIQIDVANDQDVVMAKNGLLAPEKIRRMTISAVVDSGASRLVLPESVVKQLGLNSSGKVKVRYADGRTAKRNRVQHVYLETLGRNSVFSATVEPKRRSALLGAIVLEELDFLVDCTNQRLVPRDKRYIVSEIE
jgi:clan AA aspartic protease